MTTIRWILSIGFVGLFLYIAVVNWVVFINNYVRKKQWSSALTLIGGASGSIGIVILPVSGAWQYWWLPLVLDWGSIPVILDAIILRVWRRYRKRQKR